MSTKNAAETRVNKKAVKSCNQRQHLGENVKYIYTHMLTDLSLDVVVNNHLHNSRTDTDIREVVQDTLSRAKKKGEV